MKASPFSIQPSSTITFKNQGVIQPSKKTTEVTQKLGKYSKGLSEQSLFYYLFDLLDTNRNINYVLQKIVDTLPSAAQFKQKIYARIVFNNFEYRTTNFIETPITLNVAFKTHRDKKGQLEIFYLTKSVSKHQEVLFVEQQLLIDAISKMIISWLNRYETEKELETMLVQLEMKIEDRTEQLKKANQKLIDMNKDINDSINYANRIQRAILPTNDIMNLVFKEAFVFYKPKDIISGDFYWLHKTANKIFYACADCTGHGVPGALMSMVGHQLLDHIIIDKKIFEPNRILEEMDLAIIKLFKKSQLSDHLRDGMAISLCVIDMKDNIISYAGAYNNAYMFVKDELVVLEADRQSIGGNELQGGKKFNKIIKEYASGDLIYMFTDGLPDQFGGPKGKKFMRKNLLNLITKNKNERMELQGEIVEYSFEKWKRNNFQVDDVTLIGVKL